MKAKWIKYAVFSLALGIINNQGVLSMDTSDDKPTSKQPPKVRPFIFIEEPTHTQPTKVSFNGEDISAMDPFKAIQALSALYDTSGRPRPTIESH